MPGSILPPARRNPRRHEKSLPAICAATSSTCRPLPAAPCWSKGSKGSKALKPAARNDQRGRRKRRQNLMAICHDARKGRNTGSHWFKPVAPTALPDPRPWHSGMVGSAFARSGFRQKAATEKCAALCRAAATLRPRAAGSSVSIFKSAIRNRKAGSSVCNGPGTIPTQTTIWCTVVVNQVGRENRCDTPSELSRRHWLSRPSWISADISTA